VHVFGRGFGSIAVDRGRRGVDDRVTAVSSDLFDGVDEPLDVDPCAALGVVFVHRSRRQRREMEEHVDVGREVVVEYARFDEIDSGVEVFGGTEKAVVEGDHVVLRCEMVCEVRTDESRTAGNEHALSVHESMTSARGEISIETRTRKPAIARFRRIESESIYRPKGRR